VEYAVLADGDVAMCCRRQGRCRVLLAFLVALQPAWMTALLGWRNRFVFHGRKLQPCSPVGACLHFPVRLEEDLVLPHRPDPWRAACQWCRRGCLWSWTPVCGCSRWVQELLLESMSLCSGGQGCAYCCKACHSRVSFPPFFTLLCSFSTLLFMCKQRETEICLPPN
jgi:hypothetical protein